VLPRLTKNIFYTHRQQEKPTTKKKLTKYMKENSFKRFVINPINYQEKFL